MVVREVRRIQAAALQSAALPGPPRSVRWIRWPSPSALPRTLTPRRSSRSSTTPSRWRRTTLTGDRIALPDVMERLERGSFLVCDAEANGLAGCVYVELRGDTGYLGLVSVASARQSLGLGRDLMAAAEDWLREAGCGVCQLWGAQQPAGTARLVWPAGLPGGPQGAVRGRQPRRRRGKPLRPVHFEIMERPL